MKKKVENKVISDEYEEEVKGKDAIVYGAAGLANCTVCPYLAGGVCNYVGGCTFRRI